MIRITLALAHISLLGCERSNENPPETQYVSPFEGNSYEIPGRPLSSAEVERLPEQLTVFQLFEEFGEIFPVDPPMFVYPSKTQDYVYIAFIDRDDEAAASRGEYDGIQITRIIHSDGGLRRGVVVWGADLGAESKLPIDNPLD